MSQGTHKVAAIQAHTVYGDRKATVDKAITLLNEAAAAGAKLVAFPEVFLGGYPRGQQFGSAVGVRTEMGRGDFLHYQQQSVAIDGPELKRLSAAIAKAGIVVSMGILEHDTSAPRGTVYCTFVVFDTTGELLIVHRKLKPTGCERCIWGEGHPRTIQVKNTTLGRIGGLICWENRMPISRAYLYQQGVEIYCAPNADGRESWQAVIKNAAMEGGCFVINSNQYAKLDDVYTKEQQASVLIDKRDDNDMALYTLYTSNCGYVLVQ